MIIEKTAIRDTQGRIVTVRERTLSPAEELAANAYRKVEAFSRDPVNHHKHGAEFTLSQISADVDAERLIDDVLELARADAELWARTGWKQILVRVVAAPGVGAVE
jgi:hypothetical protein